MIDDHLTFQHLTKFMLEVFISFLLSILPKSWLLEYLKKLIKNNYHGDFDHIQFYKSGRSSLTAVFQFLEEKYPESIVLLPDYLCNVVYKAAKSSGLNIRSYHTDDHFKPDIKDIKRYLDDHRVCAVLFASILGAQNNSKEIIETIRNFNSEVFIIFDECQNLIPQPNLEYDDRTVVVISFNKQTQGALGGAICLPENFPFQIHQPGWKHAHLCLEFQVCGILFNQLINQFKEEIYTIIKRKNIYSKPPFEYSHSLQQYSVDIQPITKMSVIRAILGFHNMKRFENQRIKNYNTFIKYIEKVGTGKLIPTDCPSTSLYIPIEITNHDSLRYLPLKGPYAIEEDKNISLRPNVYAIYNNGWKIFF